MNLPSLTDAEHTVLEEMAIHGPNRDVAVPVRGRLALYKLIDETPAGWKITALGRQALQAAPMNNSPAPTQKKGGRSPDSDRHYGKKTRDTSWFG
jgi:hypothetical protein